MNTMREANDQSLLHHNLSGSGAHSWGGTADFCGAPITLGILGLAQPKVAWQVEPLAAPHPAQHRLQKAFFPSTPRGFILQTPPDKPNLFS